MESPTDFSEVLDLQTHDTCTTEFTQHHSQLLGKTVYSLHKHPGDTLTALPLLTCSNTSTKVTHEINASSTSTGCHIIPGLLNDSQQQELFRDSLMVFPEPPNRSNLTAQHGRLRSLWAAAQQGLYLQHSHNESTSAQSATHTDTYANRQKPSMQATHSTDHATSSTTVCMAAASSCDSLSNLGSVANQQQNAATQFCGCCHHLSSATSRSTETDPQSCQQPSQTLHNHESISQQGRWQSAPGGPSAASLLHKLRWVALGPQFNWSTRQYEEEPGVKPLPPHLVSLAQHVVSACQEVYQLKQLRGDPHPASNDSDCSMQADFPEHAQHASNASMLCHEGTQPCQYEPDTALVNFYREGDTLGGHKDDAEDHSDCPIVSLSLGCDAVFLIGGATKDVAPTAVWLHSGDAVVLSGPARQCYHGVPRVLPGRMLFDGTAPACAKEVAAYMQTTRVNLSIRQT